MTFPALESALDDPRLGWLERRIYRLAVGMLDMQEHRPLPLSVLARHTGKPHSHLSAARSRLVKLGYLIRGLQHGRMQTFRLSWSTVTPERNNKSA